MCKKADFQFSLRSIVSNKRRLLRRQCYDRKNMWVGMPWFHRLVGFILFGSSSVYVAHGQGVATGGAAVPARPLPSSG